MSHASLAHARYEGREVLGQGAQGVVLRVVDRESPSRALVAKVWRARAHDEGALASEFALLARLHVRGLVRAHDLGRDARTGVPFFVEDFVDGPEAADWIAAAERGARANARLVRVLGDVAAALGGLHDAGFVHGDIKPAHVRVVERGADAAQAVLLDLGAAVSRACPGDAPAAFTAAFASPEARAGGRVTAASDLYGLGALAWAVAAGEPPPPAARRPPLRARAPWVQPALADLVAALLAEHPGDRPSDAGDVLRRLGAAGHAGAIAAPSPPPPIGRERELRELLGDGPHRARWVVGPSGTGKSHLVRELVTRALLAGRDARLLVFPGADATLVSRLVAYLRGADEAWPFATRGPQGDVLLVLDGLDAAPRELAEALDAWRCRRDRDGGPRVVATARTAPPGAHALSLGPLDDAAFAQLCGALGLDDATAVDDAARASGRNPGWLVASCGRVPLSRDVALARARALSTEACVLLASLALCGGTGPATLAAPAAARELLRASLVTRQVRAGETRYALATAPLATELAAALATFEIADRTATALLDAREPDAAALLAVAQGPVPPARREDLLERAAAAARAQGARSEEMDALFALAASPVRRDAALLCRLERLTRDSGSAAAHPQVLEWLDEAARRDPSVRTLALRRRAERAARESRADEARSLADEACAAAAASGDAAAGALAVGTAGAIALWRGDWTQADALLSDARARLASVEVADPEEGARLDHNFGVVALYRGRVPDAIAAFGRSLEAKRRLGDRSGVRSCLLNLGLALAKAERCDDAARALDEAVELARSLGQTTGLAWSLAARADVEVRRGRAADAERWIAEAEALGEVAAPVVRADLLLLRARVALLEGDGDRALQAVARIDGAVRAEQALVDARARVLEARGHLVTLPADRRRAARLAVDAVRRSRAAALPEVEAEAIAALREARGGSRGARDGTRYPSVVGGAARIEADGGWEWLAGLAAGTSMEDAALALARLVARESGAERAFVAAVDGGGVPTRAWGVDLDGIALASPEQRLEAELARSALACAGAVYQRDVETAGGRGSRIAAASPASDASGGVGALVVAEHRFQPARFDHVREDAARRWATLAGVLLRLRGSGPADDATIAAAARDASGASSRIDALSTELPRLEPRRSFPDIVGSSPALRRALAKLDAAADGDLPVLVVGETGVGKELFARALHEHGRRAGGPFVAVNCAAIPDALFEAELFGHARGSFTGADRARQGLVARAEGGTLLLDEIGEMPLVRQAALLRALESRRFRPVGADDERPFDVRVVAATNRDLAQAAAQGTFRRDLLYRLNVVEIAVPPLRERREDVPLLARSFLERAGSRATIAPDAIALLAAYDWPGNVRELEHAMQRAAAAGVTVLRVEHLPRALRAGRATGPAQPPDERAEVERALARAGGNISHAARALGLTRQGLKKKMVRLGIRAAAGEARGRGR